MSQTSVIACRRSGLHQNPLPKGVNLVEVPCTGRTSVPFLLHRLAHGDDGVIVLGRHQETCRLRGAEDPARDRTAQAQLALELTGVNPGRVQFVIPDAGCEGPANALHAFVEQVNHIGPASIQHAPSGDGVIHEGLDTSLSLLAGFARNNSRRVQSTWPENHGLSPTSPGACILLSGSVPHLHVLAETLVRPIHLPDLLGSALAVLAYLGVHAGLQIGGLPGGLSPSEIAYLRQAPKVYTLCRSDKRALEALGVACSALDETVSNKAVLFPRPDQKTAIAYDGSDHDRETLEHLGFVPIDVGPDPLPPRFALTPTDRSAAEARIQKAEQLGAKALLVSDSLALARWALVARQGAWQTSRILPSLGHHLAWLNLRHLPITSRTLTHAVQVHASHAEASHD